MCNDKNLRNRFGRTRPVSRFGGFRLILRTCCKAIRFAPPRRREAIKAQCLEYVGWLREEARACTAPACPLYPYRSFVGVHREGN